MASPGALSPLAQQVAEEFDRWLSQGHRNFKFVVYIQERTGCDTEVQIRRRLTKTKPLTLAVDN